MTTLREDIEGDHDTILNVMERTLATLRFVQAMQHATTDAEGLDVVEAITMEEAQKLLYSASAAISAMLADLHNTVDGMILDVEVCIAQYKQYVVDATDAGVA